MRGEVNESEDRMIFYDTRIEAQIICAQTKMNSLGEVYSEWFREVDRGFQ